MDIEAISKAAIQAVEGSADLRSLDDVRVRYLGKKGELTGLLKGLGGLSAEERPAAGAAINDAKTAVQQAIDVRKSALEQEQLAAGSEPGDHQKLFFRKTSDATPRNRPVNRTA